MQLIRISPSLLGALGISLALVTVPLRAQDVSYEIVSGRVTDDSLKPLAAATVHVTRGPDRLVQQTTTDSTGSYSVRFEPGTGDYLVSVSITGYRSARRRVQRQGGERELVANFTLANDAATLAAVRVEANRPVRARPTPARPTEPEAGSAETWKDGVSGSIPPTVAGDLGALAATIPGVTLGPGGISILGSSSESNLTTLNGMGLAASSIPRAARVETRVTGATFDPTRGGFAGANVDVRLGPGDRFYQRRNAFLTIDPPSFQVTDAIGRAAGAPSGGLRGSVGADGELIRQVLTYNVALDLARSASDPSTLVDAERETLIRAGIAPDSVERLLAAARPLGVVSATGMPSSRQRDAITWLGRLDDTRDTLRQRTLTTYAGSTKESALGFGPLVAPAAGGERRETTYGGQIVLGEYVGAGRNTLNESRLAASRVMTKTDPYRALPGATVLVRSPAEDATAQTDVTGVALGGSPFLFSDDSRWTIEGSNETTWNARGRRHRFRTALWGRGDGLTQEAVNNRFGSFSFASIEDFAANRPSSFTRTISQPERSGTVWNAAAAVSHQFIPSRYFSTIYGLRAEASGFADQPPRSASLESALGVRTGAAPTRFHVSPRAGFTWTYNRDRDNGQGTMQNPVGRFYRTMAGTVRGGIGEFRDLLRPSLLADASTVGGTSLLSCVGSAVPVPDWSAYAADPSSIPTQCVGGTGPLAERAPAATLIDEAYDVPRSWRASLDWSTSFKRILFRLGALGSYDLNQPGTVDANFAGVPRFALDAGVEGGRPVYVTTEAIDTASGAVSAALSRRSSEWSRVGVRTSDLRGYGGQLTTTIAPDVFKFRGAGLSLYSSLSYTLQSSKRQYRGFDGAGFGDPRDKEWAPSANDARHVVIASAGFTTRKTGTLTLFARAQSGLPFTPLVQGDVNGDGRGGDRAFIPLTGSEGDPAFASQLQALLASGSDAARRCVADNRGKVAPRNGCRGPWTESLNMQWRPPLPRGWGRRVQANVYLENVLGGLDQLFHGSSDLRGWGTTATPDPVLLIPRGFDTTAKRFRYDVNPRFADTRPSRTTIRNPFRVMIDFSVDLAVDYPLQQLRRAMEPVRAPDRSWSQRSADSLTAFYLRNTSSIHKALVAESDSLFLSASQVAQLRRADSVFSARVRTIYMELGQYLASRRGHEPAKAELDSANATEKTYWKIFWEQPEIADSIVTPSQKALMPMFARMVEVPQRERENSRWQFGNAVTLTDKPAPTQSPPGVNVQRRP